VAALLENCRDRPDLFDELFLNRPAYWSRQKDLCRSVVEYRTTVAYSGNMVGKDFWIADIVLWWLLTRPNSLCMVTGPSQMVLGSVTFKEIRRCLDRASLPFRGKLSSGLRASPADRLDTTHPAYAPPTPCWGPAGCPPRSIPQRPFHFCPGQYFARLVDELRPLTYGQVGSKIKLMPEDEWATILGHSPDIADALIQSMILSP